MTTMKMTYKEHPLATLLPMMLNADLRELAEDILQNGQLAPITLLDGMILDGRNRYQACLLAGVEPRVQEFKGKGDPLAFIISANVRRRQLTESQRALVAAKIANMKSGERTDLASQDARSQTDNLASQDARSQTAAADQLDVSRSSVQRAKEVLTKGTPEEIADVESGKKTVVEVARDIKARAAKPEKPAEPLDKTGYPIPEEILAEWDRATEVAQSMLTRISQLRTELKKGLESDLIFVEVLNTTVADLNNAYGGLKLAKPHAICSSCAGHNRKKCNLCKGRGFLSQFAWDSYVPREIKEMRKSAGVAGVST